jgi:hypothetical protein
LGERNKEKDGKGWSCVYGETRITLEDVRKGRVKDMIGFQEIKCHVVFNVKMDFTRKAWFVAGGHMTQPATSMTYSSVVSRDSVRIAFLLATLNGLQVL